MHEPSPFLKNFVEEIIGEKSICWRRPDLGLSKAERFSVQFTSGDRVFVKAATDDDTEAWLRNERRVLAFGGSFQPGVVAFIEPPGARPILVTEDLSRAYWPASHAGVRWRPGDIDRVLDAVRRMSATRAPDELGEHTVAHAGPHWPTLLSAPEEFLRLELCDEAWLARAGSALATAEVHLDPRGEALVHGDVRSDNICIRDEDVIFVDWSSSGRGDPMSDLAELLPTLHLEGGPTPYSVMPAGAGWASSQAGSLARRAIGGRLRENDPASAPAWLLRVFGKLASINLAWAAACLDLPPPDGGAESTGG
jgi:hypothetical protein